MKSERERARFGSFAFALVRPGAEPWLKAEVVRTHPGLKLAFSRPGLLTFKDPGARLTPSFGAELVHARVAGVSLGLFDTVEPLATDVIAETAAPVHLHVFSRLLDDEGRPAPAPTDAVRERLVTALGAQVSGAALEPGALVLDVAVQEGEPLVAGLHAHGPGRSAAPGGVPGFTMPESSPSRAYTKLREALELAGEAMRPGESAVELGCAPGGTTLAMLEAGVTVTGVDPAEMSAAVLAFVGPAGAKVRHLKIPAGALVPARLPTPLDWLVSDLNLAPPVALRYVARVVQARTPRRGAILTLKINDQDALEQLDDHLDRIRGMGFGRLLVRQLPSNKSEITVVARKEAASPR